MEKFKKPSGKKTYSDYDHQKQIAGILDQMDKMDQFSTIISVPTGGGKTKIAGDFCREKLELEEGNKVLWLCGSIDLLMQTVDRFNSMGFKKDVQYQIVCSTPLICRKNKWERGTRKKSGEDGKRWDNAGMDEIEEGADILFASIQTVSGHNGGGDSAFKNWLKEFQEPKKRN